MAYKAKQLILHGGFAKTGTSALQHALFEQRNKLYSDYQTLYPGVFEAHHYLRGAFSARPEDYFMTQVRGPTSREEIKKFYAGYLKNVLSEINRKKPERIIFSSEFFTEMNQDDLLRLRPFLESLAEEIILFVYVRDPWSWSLSLRQEQIRTGWIKKETTVAYKFPLRERLEHFGNTLGGKMVVAPYLPKPGGFDVVIDFYKRFGFKGLLPFEKENPRLRSGMNLEAAALMLQLNQYHPAFDENKAYIPDPARSLAAEIIQESPLSKTPLRISRRTAREIYKASKADIDYVEKKYFEGRKYFTEFYRSSKFADFDDSISIASFSLESLSEYLLSCLVGSSERVLYLRKNNQSLSSQLDGSKRSLQELSNRLEERARFVSFLESRVAGQQHVISSLESGLVEKEQVISSLHAQVAGKEQAISSLESRVVEKEQVISSLHTQVAEKQQAISSLESRVAEKEQAIADRETQLAGKDRQVQDLSFELSEIKISKAWKMALFFRSVRLFFIPVGSWQERFLKRLFSK